jgi:hypothetical protein
MRKMIMMAIAGLIWRKVQTRLQKPAAPVNRPLPR